MCRKREVRPGETEKRGKEGPLPKKEGEAEKEAHLFHFSNKDVWESFRRRISMRGRSGGRRRSAFDSFSAEKPPPPPL